MAFDINEFKSNFAFGGARPSQFDVILTAPGALAGVNIASSKLRFTCKAASIPQQEIEQVDVSFFGRIIKYAGNITFADWNVRVINDEDWVVRSALEQWNNAINAHEANLRHNGTTSNPSTYKGTAIVRQYSKEGEVLQEYTFKGIWPKIVGEIELNWENGSQIEEFECTLAYDAWTRGVEIV